MVKSIERENVVLSVMDELLSELDALTLEVVLLLV